MNNAFLITCILALGEFEASLQKMMAGNMTLVSEVCLEEAELKHVLDGQNCHGREQNALDVPCFSFLSLSFLTAQSPEYLVSSNMS
jgi:hypothetical protein